jgi:polysaccharide pyruvyl transferase WcaK-like protein
MRILLDLGVYDLRNKGNVALFQAAVERVRRLWPEAALDVLTSAPNVLRLYCRSARAINPETAQPAARKSGVVSRLLRASPVSALRLMLEIREALWHRWPARRRRLDGATSRPPERPRSTGVGTGDRPGVPSPLLDGVDLFVATGAQYMSDACKDDALRVLDRLEAASRRGIPTAMVGQGVGPFDDPELRSRAGSVYPLVNLILIRDRLAGPPLLSALGVDPRRVLFTGDDAIEMGYRERRRDFGRKVGVSLRLSHYTLVHEPDIATIRLAMHEVRVRYGARLIAIPISYSSHEQDERVLEQIVGRQGVRRWLARFEPPRSIVRRVGCCRLVVTGTFHTAVFALAQGIPAIGLARTRQYLEKFASLADQFGPGCEVIDLNGSDVGNHLTQAIDRAWHSAERLRPSLLEAAKQQMALGEAAYRRLYEMVNGMAHSGNFEVAPAGHGNRS